MEKFSWNWVQQRQRWHILLCGVEVIFEVTPQAQGWKMDAGGQAESSPFFTPDKPQHSFTRCGGRAEGGTRMCLLLKAGREELEKKKKTFLWCRRTQCASRRNVFCLGLWSLRMAELSGIENCYLTQGPSNEGFRCHLLDVKDTWGSGVFPALHQQRFLSYILRDPAFAPHVFLYICPLPLFLCSPFLISLFLDSLSHNGLMQWGRGDHVGHRNRMVVGTER